jgi:hypothetical protein
MDTMSGSLVGGAGSGAAAGAQVGGPWGAAIGGVAGLGMGFLGGSAAQKAQQAQKKALALQEAAQRAEMQRRAQGVGAARTAFGDVADFGQSFYSGSGAGAAQDPSKFQDLKATELAHAQISGGIEDQASAVRDAGMQGLTTGAQQAKVAMNASTSQRGLMGSSLTDAAKQQLLGQYVSGRGDVAGAVAGTRQSGAQNITQMRQGFESAANAGDTISGQVASIGKQGAIESAKSQIPYTMFGNLLNTGIGTLNQGMQASAQGGAGVSALGLGGTQWGQQFQPRNQPVGASLSGRA